MKETIRLHFHWRLICSWSLISIFLNKSSHWEVKNIFQIKKKFSSLLNFLKPFFTNGQSWQREGWVGHIKDWQTGRVVSVGRWQWTPLPFAPFFWASSYMNRMKSVNLAIKVFLNIFNQCPASNGSAGKLWYVTSFGLVQL